MTQNCPKEKTGAMTEQVKDGELLGKMGKQGDPGIAAGPTLQMHGRDINSAFISFSLVR